MSVEAFPNSGVPAQVTGRQIWDAPAPTDKQVWAICPYLRNLERCKGCPRSEQDENYGEVTRGCRALAEEACRVVEAAKQ